MKKFVFYYQNCFGESYNGVNIGNASVGIGNKLKTCFILFLMFSCSILQAQVQQQNQSEKARIIQQEKELERNDKEFYDFLKQFTSDKKFQYERVADLLKPDYIVNNWEVGLSNLRIFYGEIELEDNVCMFLNKNSSTEYEYIIGWCESEIACTLRFNKIDRKWFLTEYYEEDWDEEDDWDEEEIEEQQTES